MISCNSGTINISGLAGSFYTFTGAEGNTAYNCVITAVRGGLSSSAFPLDTGPVATPACPNFLITNVDFNGSGNQLRGTLTTAGSPKNTNTVGILVTNVGTSFTGDVELSMKNVSGATSAFTVAPHLGATTLRPGQTTTLYVTVSGARPAGTYNGFVNIKGVAPTLGIEHTIAVPLKINVKAPGFEEI